MQSSTLAASNPNERATLEALRPTKGSVGATVSSAGSVSGLQLLKVKPLNQQALRPLIGYISLLAKCESDRSDQAKGSNMIRRGHDLSTSKGTDAATTYHVLVSLACYTCLLTIRLCLLDVDLILRSRLPYKSSPVLVSAFLPDLQVELKSE